LRSVEKPLSASPLKDRSWPGEDKHHCC